MPVKPAGQCLQAIFILLKKIKTDTCIDKLQTTVKRGCVQC